MMGGKHSPNHDSDVSIPYSLVLIIMTVVAVAGWDRCSHQGLCKYMSLILMALGVISRGPAISHMRYTCIQKVRPGHR